MSHHSRLNHHETIKQKIYNNGVNKVHENTWKINWLVNDEQTERKVHLYLKNIYDNQHYKDKWNGWKIRHSPMPILVCQSKTNYVYSHVQLNSSKVRC